MKQVVIHSDGGCQGNPGPGGWAAVLEYGGHKRELSGGEPATTNNRMELQAAIEALAALKEPCEITFYTDSEYVRNGVTAWLFHWKRNGWRTKSKAPVKNEDLWRALDAAKSTHKIEWRWLKGHAGHAGNERCDQLAGAEMEKIKKTHSPGQLKALLERFSNRTDPDQASRLPFDIPIHEEARTESDVQKSPSAPTSLPSPAEREGRAREGSH